MGKLTRILSISDLHIPYNNNKILRSIIRREATPDTTLILNGDIFDLSAVSSFIKDTSASLRTEYEESISLLEWLSPQFKKIYLTRGNHELRLNRYLSKRINPEISWLMSGADILQTLAMGKQFDVYGRPIGRASYRNVSYDMDNKWWVKLGDCIFCHPNTFSRVDMKTSILALTHFRKHGMQPRAIVCAHTHHVGMIYYEGAMLMEQGATCDRLDYEHGGNLHYGPSSLGYALIIQRRGKTLLDNSYVRYLGTS